MLLRVRAWGLPGQVLEGACAHAAGACGWLVVSFSAHAGLAVAFQPEQPAQAGCAAVPFDAGKFLQAATAKPHNKRLDLFFCV